MIEKWFQGSLNSKTRRIMARKEALRWDSKGSNLLLKNECN